MTKKSRIEPLPYYKWQWRDYRANRKVQRMSWQAKGLYRELLDEFWVEGVLPADHAELAHICGCSLEEFEEFWPQLESSWDVTDAGLVNRKMDEQRTDMDSTRAAKARAGSIGGKLSNSYTRAQSDASTDKQTQADAKHVLTDAKHVLAESKQTQASADIARAEQSISRAEKIPSRGKRETPKVVDVRHVPFRLACEMYAKHKGVTFVWDASEAKALALLLAAAPELTLATFQKCLTHRSRSPAVLHGDRPRMWLGGILSFEAGPINQFKQPEGTNGTNQRGHGKAGIAQSELLAAIAANRGDEGTPGDANAGPSGYESEPWRGDGLDSAAELRRSDLRTIQGL